MPKNARLSRSSPLISFIESYIDELTRSLTTLDKGKIGAVIETLLTAYKQGRKVFILGNGGSAATASHMACDLSKGTLARIYDEDEPRFKVYSLTDNVATLTAFGNDLSFDDIFVQQLRNLVEKDDVVIVLSGSGNSKNCIKAVTYARKCGAKTVGFLGFTTGGKLAAMVDIAVIAASNHYGPSEDIQLILDHIIVSWIARVKHRHDGKNSRRLRNNRAVPFR